MKLDFKLIEELGQIQWFDKCGKVTGGMSSLVQLKSWASVKVACSDVKWIETTENAQGDLTEYLSTSYPKDYQGVWNNLIKEARNVVNETVGMKAEMLAEENNLPQDFVDGAKWDVLHAVMELSYKSKNPPVFFERLFDVYRYGHYPCGMTQSGEIIFF